MAVFIYWASSCQFIQICITYFKFSAHATTIQCRTGAGASAGNSDANLIINYKDCDEGVTQCKLSGGKVFGKFISTEFNSSWI